MLNHIVGRTGATILHVLVLLCLVTAGSLSSQPARAAGPATLVKTFGDDVIYTGGSFELKGKQFFVVERHDASAELWQSDGTSGGTTVFQSSIGAYHVVNDILYFEQCNDPQAACKLMKSDGTVAGTQTIKQLGSSLDDRISRMLSVNNTLIFFDYWSLWRSDGTDAGTIPLTGNLRSGSFSECGYPIRDFQTINGFLYFKVCHENNGSNFPAKLQIWKTNGTAVGTSQVGPNLPYDEYSRADQTPMVFLNGSFYVDTGYSRWQVNPSTNIATQITWLPCNLLVWNNQLFCMRTTYNGSIYITDIWISNGSAAGTSKLRTFTGNESPSPKILSVTQNKVFFVVNDGVHGAEVWQSDGTVAGTVLVKDINSGSASAFPYGVHGSKLSIDGVLFFMADDGVHGTELWKTDGTTAGTMLVKDITSGSGDSFIWLLQNVDGTVLFTVDGQLWKTTPNQQGATLIQNIAVDTVLWRTGNNVFLSASSTSTSSKGLWKLPLSAITTPPETKKVFVLVHGWQGLVPSASGYIYQCEDAVRQYVKPAQADEKDEFGRLAYELAADGHIVYFARWTTGMLSTMKVQDAAKTCLAPQIEEVITQQQAVGNPISKVTLVAHSMGGLVSRAYIEDSELYKNNVNHLITFGTPHAGVAGLTILLTLSTVGAPISTTAKCKIDPGFCQLAADYVIKQFNTRYQPNAAVRYDFVGGDATNFWNGDNSFANVMYLTEGGNDGIVGRNSATGFTRFGQRTVYGSCVGRWHTGDAHSTFVQSPQHTAYFNSSQSVNYLRSFLLPGRSCNSASVQQVQSVQQAAPASEDEDISFTTPTTGTLTFNQTRTVPLWVDGTTAQLFLGWHGGTPDWTLTTPDGTMITPSTVGQVLPSSQYMQQANSDALSLAAYRLENPASGEWQATITATAVTTPTDFVLLGAMKSPLTLTVDRPSSVTANAPFTLTATLQNGDTSVSGVQVSAKLLTDVGVISVPLNETAAGIYAATITAPLEAGQYQLIVRANGPIDNPFSREDNTFLTIRPNDVQRVGAPTVQANDTNGNGLFDVLNLTVPIHVNRAGFYVANATLRAPNGDEITRERISVDWSNGQQNLLLAFNGRYIGSANIDGPYTVNLEVVASDTLQLTLDEQPLLETGAYTAKQFEQLARIYLPSVLLER